MKGERTLRPRAKRDLAQIWRYTAATWSIQQADAYLREIESSMDRLTVEDNLDTPSEAGGPGCFKRRVGSHVIFYRRSATGVDVIRVLHGRMDVPRHL